MKLSMTLVLSLTASVFAAPVAQSSYDDYGMLPSRSGNSDSSRRPPANLVTYRLIQQRPRFCPRRRLRFIWRLRRRRCSAS